MRRTVGIDLGPNSIGWASIIEEESNENLINKHIEKAGCRIIPMDSKELSDYDSGNLQSQASERTRMREVRRMIERRNQRRSRLNRILNILGFLPEHYSIELDQYGNFPKGEEPKIAWRKNNSDVYEFIFRDSFNEMVAQFKSYHSDIKNIPYDWTIYYLRNKALSQPISREELAWILLQFNKKRGYFQLCGEETENKDKKEEYFKLKVTAVEKTDEWTKGKIRRPIYNILFENGLKYSISSGSYPDWVDNYKDIIVTTKLDKEGKPKITKEGNIDYSIRFPEGDDWDLMKTKTEADLVNTGKTIGSYVYSALLINPSQKLNGGLIRTVERDFYKNEITEILEKQKEFHPELRDRSLYEKCIDTLYKSNDTHRNSIMNYDFTYLLRDDILLYQRPLKSKKSCIADCKYEKKVFTTIGEDGKKEIHRIPLKCAPRSHPLFQELRLWQFISNLHIYQREANVNGKIIPDYDITSSLLRNDDDYVKLFDILNDKKEIKQNDLISIVLKLSDSKTIPKNEVAKYRWNNVEDKTYPCNKTREAILSKLTKDEKAKLTPDLILDIWHMMYSVVTKKERESIFVSGKETNPLYSKLRDNFSAETINKIKSLSIPEDDYCAYSVKALNRLLPLLRRGKYWNEDKIDTNTLDRINKIIAGEYDESIDDRIREKATAYTASQSIAAFQGLPTWFAEYVVYGIKSSSDKWNTPDDIDTFINNFKRNSLNNPTVERIIMETLRTIRDIWRKYGTIDEFHIEMARDLKQTKDQRIKATNNMADAERTNFRIKVLLEDFFNDSEIENVKPNSPMQMQKLKIFEDGCFSSKYIYEDGVFVEDSKIPEDITAIQRNLSNTDKSKRPSKSEFNRYKLWLGQRYRSPYTGELIPLARLFTSDYQIEHVIPQSRYFNDSFSNKVICEAEVNKLKDNMLGLEFIKNHHGQKVLLHGNKTVTILSEEAYIDLIKCSFNNNRAKYKIMLLEDIPADFSSRQLNDTRYITKLVMHLLSNIVRVKDANGIYEPEETSKNVIVCNGSVTDYLKRDWGVNDVWNRIILPRFEALDAKNSDYSFTAITNGHKIPNMPLEFQLGFNKKRIDHRHHAMDAIVIACTTRNHVNLISNESACEKDKKGNRWFLSHKLRCYEETIINGKERSIPKEFIKPWETFTSDVEKALRDIVVSFKQNLKIVSATSNRYEHYVNGKKVITTQSAAKHLSIRKQMHNETFYGNVNLRMIKTVNLNNALENLSSIVDKDLRAKLTELKANGMKPATIKNYFVDNKETWKDIDINKIECYYFTNDTKDKYCASRKPLSILAGNDYKKTKDKIAEITDTGIQKILLNYIADKDDNSIKDAFTQVAIEEFNKNISNWNDGKPHQPIYKVRISEVIGNKFIVGNTGNKSSKYVISASNSLLYYMVYSVPKVDKKTGEETAERKFFTPLLKTVIDCQKQDLKRWKEILDCKVKAAGEISQDAALLFILSPRDYIYTPNQDELKNGITSIDKNRLYKVVNFSEKRLYISPYAFAYPIIDTELIHGHKFELSTADKQTMIPVKVNRIGDIISINNKDV